MKKIISMIFVFSFMGIIIVPVVLANRENDTVSTTENRYLSNLPTASFGSEEYKEQLENWLGDNIAFRDKFLDIRSSILFKGFNVVSSENVQKGKDGWLFYTLNDNIEIAKGRYVLDETVLKKIAEVQQGISDYYKKLGKTYILLLTPSKVSIYPEKLYGNYTITQTPIDIVTEYLTDNTDVIVVNPKEYLLDAKDEGQVYWKTDTHMTSFGAYYVYKALIEKMNQYGLTDYSVIEADKAKTTMQTDLMGMLGCGKDYQEEGDAITFKESSIKITEGEYYQKISDVCENGAEGVQSYSIYSNNSEEPIILIYGNSQLQPVRKIPQLLAESFSKVVYLYQSPVSPIYSIDSVAEADIVIAAVGERSIKDVLNVWPQSISVELPDIEMKENNMAKSFLFLERCNGNFIDNKAENLASYVSETGKMCSLEGWAIDVENLSEFSDIYLKLGKQIIKGHYGIVRKDVSSYYKQDSYTNVGFNFNFSSSFLFDENGDMVDSFEFILVGKDGRFMYEPIVYQINDKETTKETTIPTITVVKLQNGSTGMWLDKVCDVDVENNKQKLKENILLNKKCSIAGWAVDAANEDSLSEIYITIGEHVVKGTYGKERKDVAEHYANDAYRYSGFTFEFDRSLLFDANGELVDEISFVLVGKDGTFMYEPIVYKLGGEE